MRIATWNIGGGFIHSGDETKFDVEDLNYFISELKKLKPDLVSLQEALFVENEQNQVVELGKTLSFPHVAYRVHSASHLKQGTSIALGILSKFPIISTEYLQLTNPLMEVTRPNGEVWLSQDKGFLQVTLKINGQPMRVLCGHNFPYHHFKRDFMHEEFNNIRGEIESIFLNSRFPTIVAADMNYDDLRKAIPNVFSNGFVDVFNEPTIPKGVQQDHVIVSEHCTVNDYKIVKGKADHYLCYVDLELK